jgi:quercetin dioxygenase-like cupin family protein
MQIHDVPFTTTDWSTVPLTEHHGESGIAWWRTIEVGNVRVRRVDYSPGYLADHWCGRGHVVYVLSGELITELEDGRSVTLQAGHSYVVADGGTRHRSRTADGAALLIVD